MFDFRGFWSTLIWRIESTGNNEFKRSYGWDAIQCPGVFYSYTWRRTYRPQAIKTTNVASYSTCFLVYWTSNVQGTRNECGIARCTACSFNAIARAYDHTKSVNIPLRVGLYMYIHTWWRKCNRGKRSCYRFCVMDNVYSTMVSFNSVDNVFARNWIIKNRFYFVRFSGV